MSKHDARAVKPLTQQEKKKCRKKVNDQVESVLFTRPDAVRNLKSGDIRAALKSLLPKGGHSEAVAQWEAFYKKFFGLTVDLSRVVIPKAPEGFNRLIIVAQGVTLNAAMKACKAHFATWKYSDDLDKSVIKNDRTAQNGAYAVWFRDRIEADEEMANKSANDLDAQNIKGITLLERILMELEYFGRTGKHLDIDNVTLCAGSRRSGGYVPVCYWRSLSGKFSVDWTYSADRSSGWRSRVAVS